MKTKTMMSKKSKALMLFFVFLFIPVVAGSIMGYEMSGGKIEAAPTVIADHDNSDLSNTLTGFIKDNAGFDVIGYPETDAELEAMLQNGEAVIGVIIPENLSDKLKQGEAPKIIVCYDASKLQMLASSKTNMTELLTTAQASYTAKIYESKLRMTEAESLNQVMPVNVTYQTLFNPARSLKDYLLPGMVAAIVQIGIALMGVEAAKGDNVTFVRSIEKIMFYGLLGACALAISLGIQYLFFDIPYNGTIEGGLLLTLLFSCCMTTFGYIVGTVIHDRVFSSQVTSFFVLPTSILGGYTFPLIAMPDLLQKIGKVLPFSYYGCAVRNLFQMPMKFEHLAPEFKFMSSFLAAELGILFLVKFLEHFERNRRKNEAFL